MISSALQFQRYKVWWLHAALVVVLGIAFFPYIFGDKTFLPSDLFDTLTAPYKSEFTPPQVQNHYIFDGLAQTYPYKLLTQQGLRNGELAYWNPHILGGYPQYAESLANNFDPLNILLLWFDPVTVIHWQTILELLIAGIGMIYLLRFVGVSRGVNFIFSVGYMLNGLFITTAHNRSILAAMCWMPFVVLMSMRYFSHKRFSDLLHASLFLALLFFGGTFQTAFYAAFILVIIFLMYPNAGAKPAFLVRLRSVAFIGVAAFALSAIMWFPSLELFFHALFHGGRFNASYAGVDYTLIQRLISIPMFLITFALPGLPGSAQSYNLRKIVGLDVMYFNGAIGFIPIVFALFGCFYLWKNKTVRPFIVIAACGVLLPIATPLFAFLYHRFFIVASFAFAVIGAATLESLLRESFNSTWFTKYFRILQYSFDALVIAVVGIWIFLSMNHDLAQKKLTLLIAPGIASSAFGTDNESWMLGRVEKTLQYYSSFSIMLWVPLLGAFISLLSLNLFKREKLTRSKLLLILGVTTSAELIAFTSGWLPAIDQKQFPIYPKNEITDFLQRDTTHSKYSTWRDLKSDPYLFTSNASNVYDIFDYHGYESITNRSMLLVSDAHSRPDTVNLRLLGLMNVKHILINKHPVDTTYLRREFTSDGMTIYENMFCKPRAYLCYQTKVLPNDSSVLQNLLDDRFDGSTALFNVSDAPTYGNVLTAGADDVQIVHASDNEISLHATNSSPCVLVLTDTYYPGWMCRVNGVETKIYETNYCMRGVPLKAGESNIVFIFDPPIYKAGVQVSLVSISLFIIALFFLKFRSGRSFNGDKKRSE
ncbi:MAG: YfhO family protein [bacterium]